MKIKEKVLKEHGGLYHPSAYDKNLFEKIIDLTLVEVRKVIDGEIEFQRLHDLHSNVQLLKELKQKLGGNLR